MISFNQVNLAGYLTADVELRAMQDGTSIAKFSLAVNEKYKGTETTLFMRCAVFGKTAEFLAPAKKGDPLLVSGRLRQNKWEKDGVVKESVELVCTEWRFLKTKSDASPAEPRPSKPAKAPRSDAPTLDDIPF